LLKLQSFPFSMDSVLTRDDLNTAYLNCRISFLSLKRHLPLPAILQDEYTIAELQIQSLSNSLNQLMISEVKDEEESMQISIRKVSAQISSSLMLINTVLDMIQTQNNSATTSNTLLPHATAAEDPNSNTLLPHATAAALPAPPPLVEEGAAQILTLTSDSSAAAVTSGAAADDLNSLVLPTSETTTMTIKMENLSSVIDASPPPPEPNVSISPSPPTIPPEAPPLQETSTMKPNPKPTAAAAAAAEENGQDASTVNNPKKNILMHIEEISKHKASVKRRIVIIIIIIIIITTIRKCVA
jgi:hypothetical protein